MDKLRKNKLAVCLFLLPALILFTLIIIVPIFMSAYYSLLDWDGMTKGVLIGLKNYINLFQSPSAGFVKTLGNALLLALLSVIVQLPISLSFALLLARGIKGERFFIAVFFIPVLISTVVIGQLWLKIYNPEYGILNASLRCLGLDALTRIWLGDKQTVLVAVFIPILWQYVGYHMLLMYAGIKSVSLQLREAAMIDGASSWKVNRFIIIPMIRPVLRICVIFAVIGSLKAFDLIYVLTNGGPSHASEVPSTLMVDMIFSRNRYGFGSAIALFIIFLCFFFALLIKKIFNMRGVFDET
ncbi:carbohydrate ABC transporter membrane protein 1 (CUT1 family) [Lachnotalea glycerini]|jgi:raffinose/stachyose/melibiose transport system permease protein|uniref:Carbohydrate ABC transporter membrane protein 1 (CUT1 family) n=1 Tax=Lachnotalea glycerini TaxID=1763509 RepID=A0A255I8Q4_9FIRM|nr:sugar ABC transporter permease [Lachnotalea glycerini]PXV95684.1 carbohydrate ABC transporter membrane protein 1 (CUT1 family) [Lachnotalea glycerini]RDY33268.1 sugar ABC transporter permease [Lachnotalea glycerini]